MEGGGQKLLSLTETAGISRKVVHADLSRKEANLSVDGNWYERGKNM